MRVKEWVDGGLVLDGDIGKGIDEAFSDGRYVEAFALLHSEVDWLLANLHQQSSSVKSPRGILVLQNLIDEHKYRFMDTLELLLKSEVVSREEYRRLRDFNEIRNRIIHRMIVHGYQPRRRNRVTRAEAERGFQEGKSLFALLEGKTLQWTAAILKSGRVVSKTGTLAKAP
jgi:hypothetical protein